MRCLARATMLVTAWGACTVTAALPAAAGAPHQGPRTERDVSRRGPGDAARSAADVRSGVGVPTTVQNVRVHVLISAPSRPRRDGGPR